MQPTDTTEQPDTATLTGRCVCCGEAETRSLFAMGHDARFRGYLAKALATGSWVAPVDWFTGPGTYSIVPVDVAIVRVARLLNRDWTEKVEKSASRIAKTPEGRTARLAVAASFSATERSTTPSSPQSSFVPHDVVEERIDRLMEALGRPSVGQWGWYRPGGGHTRFSARIQAIPRDEIGERTGLIELFIPAQPVDDGVTTRDATRVADPAREWIRDEDAKL